jgi:hypothetical protein
MSNYGLRWNEFNKKGELVAKERWFDSEESRERFLDKLYSKESFHSVSSTSDPKPS